MSADLLAALAAFAFVGSITPGPNNAMLLASGVNFGVARTVPHALGVTIGFSIMVVAVGLGLGAVFEAVPALYDVLRYAGAAYLLYLAWRIANAGPPSESGTARGRPMRFIEAAAFQWVNPKAWVLAVGATATYAPPEDFFLNVLAVSAVFAAVNLPCISIWVGFGAAMRRLLSNPRILRVFNIAMALSLVASLIPVFWDDVF